MKDLELHAGSRAAYTVAKRLAFVQFVVDYTGLPNLDEFGTGFSLLYEETGTIPTGSPNVFLSHDSTELSGNFKYPVGPPPPIRNDIDIYYSSSS